MNKLDIYGNLVTFIDEKIAIAINQESILLCNTLKNEQNIVNPDAIINEIKNLNDYIQNLFKNGFNESELILERQIQYNSYSKDSIARVLFCRRINKKLTKILSEYCDNNIFYDVVFDRIIFINKLFLNDKCEYCSYIKKWYRN